MTADDDARDPSATLTVADALDALVDAGVDMGEAKELANAAVAKGLDGGPFWNALYARQDKLAAARTAALAAIDAAEQAAWHAGLDEGVARASTPPPQAPGGVDRGAFEAALTEYGIARSDFGAARGDERKRERLDIAYDARRALLALVFGDSAPGEAQS